MNRSERLCTPIVMTVDVNGKRSVTIDVNENISLDSHDVMRGTEHEDPCR